MKCTKCFQEKDLDCFVEKSKTLKNCSDCRNKAKLWRAKNKERISDYNKLKKIEKKKIKRKLLRFYMENL